MKEGTVELGKVDTVRITFHHPEIESILFILEKYDIERSLGCFVDEIKIGCLVQTKGSNPYFYCYATTHVEEGIGLSLLQTEYMRDLFDYVAKFMEEWSLDLDFLMN